MKKKILPVLALIAGVFLFLKGDSLWYGLFPKGQKFGVAFNEERKKRDIPVLPGNWVTKDNASDIKRWFPPDSSHEATYRSMKITSMEDGRLVYEEDHIVHHGPHGREVLSIGYNYDSSNPWECEYAARNNASRAFSPTRQQTDSILAAWNFTIRQINRE